MPSTWVAFDAKLPVLTFTYSFGPGRSNALAVGVTGGLAVVSPPWRVADAAFDELERYGPVKALVASNAFHYLGVPDWKRRFPDAVLYAPAQSIARVQRRTGLSPILPIGEGMKTAGAGVEFIDMPHYKTGEMLVKMSIPRGRAWYVTDVVMNFEAMPRNPVAHALFAVSRSGPGLRFNNLASLFMVQDKRALKRWLAAEVARDPPDFLIPAHGPVVDCAAQRGDVEKLFAS
jgi:hypothetical protein